MEDQYWTGMAPAAPRTYTFVRPDHPTCVYPNVAGHRGVSTSIAAAKDIDDRRDILYERIIRALTVHGPMTPEEICARIGESRNAVAPRCTELEHQYGVLRPNGQKRQNVSGKWARVLMVTPET